MTLSFAIIAVLIIGAATAAMTLRNLVHSALAAAAAFAGLAAVYLQLDAQFVGLAQILVYVGAVAILIVFAVLLTRGGQAAEISVFSATWFWGAAIATAVFALLAFAINHSVASQRPLPAQPSATVEQIGQDLMTKFVLPLEVIGLLLTAALIGAVIIAMRDESPKVKMEGKKSELDESSGPSSILHPPSSNGVHQ
jgi:NADH-quinone oxidoreductase subunit J